MSMKRIILAALVLSSFLSSNTQLFAQNVMVTYQGHVTSSGADFNGSGEFKFALVTSTNFNKQATATASAPSGGFITIITVGAEGSGYTNAPAVSISGGGGTGAIAHSTVSGGVPALLRCNGADDRPILRPTAPRRAARSERCCPLRSELDHRFDCES